MSHEMLYILLMPAQVVLIDFLTGSSDEDELPDANKLQAKMDKCFVASAPATNSILFVQLFFSSI